MSVGEEAASDPLDRTHKPPTTALGLRANPGSAKVLAQVCTQNPGAGKSKDP